VTAHYFSRFTKIWKTQNN